MKLDELPLESIVLALVVVGVFAAVFFFTQLVPKPTDQTLNGVRVIATGNAKTQLQSLLARHDPVLTEIRLYEGNDTRNSALSVVAAQVSASLIQQGRRNIAYGSVNGNASINCVNETNFCQGAVIVVQIGECNCLRINDQKAVVEGSESFYKDFSKVSVIAGVFGLAAARQ